MTKKSEPESKTFTLKPIQVQMIKALQDNHFSNLANFLSLLASENWSYQVTPTTRFAIDDNNNCTITEVAEEPPKEEEEVATA